jgi:hypothetical protein
MGIGGLMAGAGRRTFVPGEILTANQVNNYLQDQTVMVFDDATDRTTAIPSPSEGMVTYLSDVNLIAVWDGTQWVRIGNAKITVQDTTPGTGLDGDLWFNDSTGSLFVWYDGTSQWITVGGGGGGGLELNFLLMGA